MTAQEALNQTSLRLRKIYSESESANIATLVMENILGADKKEWRKIEKILLTEGQEFRLENYSTQLLNHKPVQYVLNEAWFGNLKLYVDENVLIPRPETEELVDWVVSQYKGGNREIKIMDIGTGSGCISLGLKKDLPNAWVLGCDISDKALAVARRNSATLGIGLSFLKLDFLDPNQWTALPLFDIIVSNPPYVPEADRRTMAKNVVDYEPSIALFVPDTDPLSFYRSIADFSKEHLNKEGMIFVEIHENLGTKVMELFHSSGYSAELKKDMQGKDRMIAAKKY